MADKRNVNVKVFRFNPETDKEPHYDTFQLEIPTIGYTVYNALQEIYKNMDPSLSFYASCRIGQCHGCLAKVNGKTVHTCTEMLTGDVTIDPINPKRVIRDLTMESHKPEEK